MDNPVIKGNFTQADIREYAYYRKACGMSSVELLLNDPQVQNGELSVEELEEYKEPLVITRETVITIELSTGGDADGYKLVFDENKQLIRGLYYWADWGVYEEVQLSDKEMDMVDQLYSVSDWLSAC